MNIFDVIVPILDGLFGPPKQPQVRDEPVEVPHRGRTCYYWQERGWKRKGNEYRGYYKGGFRPVEGKIIRHPGDSLDVYCRGLPEQLKQHRHWQCFHSREDGWFWIHWVEGRQPPSVSAAVLGVERLLTEVYS